MIKAILLDADGVAIKQHRYFSEVYAEECGVPLEKVTPFFKEKFPACQKGQADLKIEIKPYLSEWKWKGTAEEFLDLWFKAETKPDKEVLELVKRIQGKGIKCYLATDQERYRAEYMDNVIRFGQIFDGTYYSCNIGHQKSEREFFEKVIADLALAHDEIAYLDDEKENVEIAKQCGIKGIWFSDINNLESLLTQLD